MNQALAREIVGCLRVSGPSAMSLVRLRAFGRREWRGTLSWLDQSGLALYVWRRLTELGTESTIPPEVQARLARNLEDNARRVAEMANEFDSLNRCFADAGVEYAALKGFALIPEYCPDALLRTQYDFDYLVRPASLRQAGEAVQRAGWVRKKQKEDHPIVYVQSTLPQALPAGKDVFYSAQLQRSVELHTRLGYAEEEKIFLGAPEDALERACGRTWEGLRFMALSDEDRLIFQVLHAFRHILNNWCRLSSFLEIARFLEHCSNDFAFWGRFSERCGCLPRTADAAGVVFSLARRLFDARVPDEASGWTDQKLSAALTLWVERYGVSSALSNFADTKFSLFLHKEFIQNPAAWREIQRRRLFPLRWLRRLAQASGPLGNWGLKTGWKQWPHFLRRLAIHLRVMVRYTWEYWRWKRALLKKSEDEACHNGLESPPEAAAISAHREKR